MSQYGPRPFNSDGTLVEYRKPGSTDWNFIPGVGDVTSSGGEPPSTDVNTFNASHRAYGRATPESITMTIPGVQISHSSYTDLREALEDGDELFFRWRYENTGGEELVKETPSGSTLAISTAGAITKAGTAHPNLATVPGVGPGAAFKITGDVTSSKQNYRVIKTIPANGDVAMVTLTANPSAAVTANVYSVVIPPVYQPEFSARVTSFTVTRSAGASASGSLSLGLLSLLPPEKVGTP